MLDWALDWALDGAHAWPAHPARQAARGATTAAAAVSQWRPMSTLLVATVGALALVSDPALAADWPQWRGPARDGCSPEKGLLSEWPEGGPKLLWQNAQAGLGYSSVAVAGGVLYTLGLVDGKERLLAFDAATGARLWGAEVGPELDNDWGDGPRSTPTVAGDAVFALSGRGHLARVDAASGEPKWIVELVDDLGGGIPDWGYAESPLFVGDLVVCTPGGERGTLAALDAATGAVRWRSTAVKEGAQYASPLLIEHNGRRQVVQLVMNQVFAVDPKSGALAWTAPFDGRTAVIPTPVFADGQVYVTAGYGVGCALFRLAADGRSVKAVYDNRVMKNHHGGVVRVGGHIYGHSDGPGWVCQDLATGEEVWSERGFGKGAVTYADGRLYCLDERTGEVALVDASPEGWRVRGKLTLAPLSAKRSSQGGVWSHAVIAGGRLYLRDQELLFCYDVTRPE